MAIDKKQAIYNSTLSIAVSDASLTESDYSLLITKYLSTSGKTTENYISQLSILSSDLSQKTTFTSSTINS